MKKTFVKPEMKCHKLRSNEMILGSKDCDGHHCYYLYTCEKNEGGDKCIAECQGDYECALDTTF